MSIKLSDIRCEDSRYECSLSKLTQREIKDIRGYFSDPFDGVVVFHLTNIEFADGTKLRIAGEHDIPYIPQNHRDTTHNVDPDTFDRLYEEQKQG